MQNFREKKMFIIATAGLYINYTAKANKVKRNEIITNAQEE